MKVYAEAFQVSNPLIPSFDSSRNAMSMSTAKCTYFAGSLSDIEC